MDLLASYLSEISGPYWQIECFPTHKTGRPTLSDAGIGRRQNKLKRRFILIF